MKQLNLFGSIMVLTIGLFIGACEKGSLLETSSELALSSDLNRATPAQDLTLSDAHLYRGARGIPFKAKFFTRFTADRLNEVTCSRPERPSPNFQVGRGTGTHLGKFYTELSFCGGDGGVYSDANGYLEAANGDRLYVKIDDGAVLFNLPEPHPVYDAYFRDPFDIVGGTGRFEGASGSGMTNSFVNLFDENGNFIPDHRTDHEWTGTLKLPKRNR